jgi:hypothetical protein
MDETEFKLHRDPFVKLLSKRLRNAEEVNASLTATLANLREQLDRVQAHNRRLTDTLRAQAPDPAPRRWWERVLDALGRSTPYEGPW